MQFSTAATLAVLSSAALASYANDTVVTVDLTVTGYTTYCPESTTITITTCTNKKCGPKTITVTEPSTITVTEECVVPTTYTTSKPVTKAPETSKPVPTTKAPETTVPVTTKAPETVKPETVKPETVKPSSAPSSTPAVTTYKGDATKQVAGGIAAVAAIAAALI